MVKRIAAIVFIWICTACAWAILGSTILYRTYESTEKLTNRVESIWGSPQRQLPPTATFTTEHMDEETTVVDGKVIKKQNKRTTVTLLELERNRLSSVLNLEYRQKGLLWYSLYGVRFAGEYTFRNPSNEAQNVTFTLPFPASQAVYDDLVFAVDGQPVSISNAGPSVQGQVQVKGGAQAVLRVGYHSRGLVSWTYDFGNDVARVRDFELKMTTDFKEIDFPENSLAPSVKRETPSGWELDWNYKNSLTGYDIAMTLPEKLQPGPLAGRISYFAPVSLFFFFFLMFIITTMRGIELHPMNYFFLAAAFFAFHLLLAYLVDHVSIHLSFAICSAVSIFLVVSYLRLVVGPRFAALEAGVSQLIYLVGFSYAFFFKGFTGLTVTIGAVITLFVVMQMTARIRWAEKFAAKPALVGPRGAL